MPINISRHRNKDRKSGLHIGAASRARRHVPQIKKDLELLEQLMKTYEKAMRNGFLDLLINERMLPSLTRNKLDGLFLNEIYDTLNSVVFVDFKGVSQRKIVHHLKQFYGVRVTQPCIVKWLRKYVQPSERICRSPSSSDIRVHSRR